MAAPFSTLYGPSTTFNTAVFFTRNLPFWMWIKVYDAGLYQVFRACYWMNQTLRTVSSDDGAEVVKTAAQTYIQGSHNAEVLALLCDSLLNNCLSKT